MGRQSDLPDVRRIEVLEQTSHRYGETIRSLVQWRDGNGAKGAEQRLQNVETVTGSLDDRVQRIEHARNQGSIDWDKALRVIMLVAQGLVVVAMYVGLS